MYKDILFSLTSDTKIGGKNLRPGTYKLVYRANQFFIWDVRNLAVTSIANQIEFDEIVMNEPVEIVNTIFSTQFHVERNIEYTYSTGFGWGIGSAEGLLPYDSKIEIIEHDEDHYYAFGPNICFKKSFIEKLIADGALVPL